MARHHRRLRNYLLSPGVQLKFSAVLVVLMGLFFAATFIYTYLQWNELIVLFVELSDIPESAQELVDSETRGFLLFLAGLLALQMLVLSIYIVILTHRFLGPAYAIEKYLKRGDFSQPLNLRKNDYLQGVATEINSRLQRSQSCD